MRFLRRTSCPSSDQVLALQIKVQTAQRFGMIVLPSQNGLVITSGVPINSIVGAMDHKGRHIDVQSLPTLEWKIVDNGREQSPCNRGKCYLPSLELCHSYRLMTEHVDGTATIMGLPTFDPSKLKELRAPRSPNAAGVHKRHDVLRIQRMHNHGLWDGHNVTSRNQSIPWLD